MLKEKLQELKWPHIANQLDHWLQEAGKHTWPYDEFLTTLCNEELSYKQERSGPYCLDSLAA